MYWVTFTMQTPNIPGASDAAYVMRTSLISLDMGIIGHNDSLLFGGRYVERQVHRRLFGSM